jgi:hypothetical protein
MPRIADDPSDPLATAADIDMNNSLTPKVTSGKKRLTCRCPGLWTHTDAAIISKAHTQAHTHSTAASERKGGRTGVEDVEQR